MVFSSFIFLFLFLPVTLTLYFITPPRFKNLTLLILSLLFYAWGAPEIVILLIVSCAADYILSRNYAQKLPGSPARFYGCAVAVSINVALLVYYKYTNFFLSQLNALLSSTSAESLTWTEIALPIGISFFTFHKISYLVDVYRGATSYAKSFGNYLLYVTFFPQLIAGPIIRYHDIADQIERRDHTLDDFYQGSCRFLLGLGRKVLIADPLGLVADHVFALNQSQLTTGYAWLGILAYSFQIYFDFAGYSDMAIGLARMFGMRFRENFNSPYISQNFTEFWRRWHISLSSWMREYLYIPLGGNKGSKLRTYSNLWIVFLISGLWHGASWNFIIWGIYHGLFLVLDRLFWVDLSKSLPLLLKVGLTYLLVTIGWVPFRADTLEHTTFFLGAMFGGGPSEVEIFRGDMIHNRAIFIFALAAIISFVPTSDKLLSYLQKFSSKFPENARLILQGFGALLLLLLSACALASAGYVPFLYFKF